MPELSKNELFIPLRDVYARSYRANCCHVLLHLLLIIWMHTVIPRGKIPIANVSHDFRFIVMALIVLSKIVIKFGAKDKISKYSSQIWIFRFCLNTMLFSVIAIFIEHISVALKFEKVFFRVCKRNF